MNVFDYVMESTNIEFHTPEELLKWMNQNIRYSNFTKLKSPEEVFTSKSGSCHDQVMFEMYCLRKMGLTPKAEFFIEYHPHKTQGGMTHSFVYYKKENKQIVAKALIRAGRRDLIGYGKECLITPDGLSLEQNRKGAVKNGKNSSPKAKTNQRQSNKSGGRSKMQKKKH